LAELESWRQVGSFIISRLTITKGGALWRFLGISLPAQ
jgi:hypothetical protein